MDFGAVTGYTETGDSSGSCADEAVKTKKTDRRRGVFCSPLLEKALVHVLQVGEP